MTTRLQGWLEEQVKDYRTAALRARHSETVAARYAKAEAFEAVLQHLEDLGPLLSLGELRKRAEDLRRSLGEVAYLDHDPTGDFDLLDEQQQGTWEGNVAAAIEHFLAPAAWGVVNPPVEEGGGVDAEQATGAGLHPESSRRVQTRPASVDSATASTEGGRVFTAFVCPNCGEYELERGYVRGRCPGCDTFFAITTVGAESAVEEERWQELPAKAKRSIARPATGVQVIPLEDHQRLLQDKATEQGGDARDYDLDRDELRLVAEVAAALSTQPLQETPAVDYERVARAFHGVYETIAPEHGYETRPESRVAWQDVPEKNRALMIGTVRRLAETGVISIPDCTQSSGEGEGE